MIIDWSAITELGRGGFDTLVIVSILTGRLVPRKNLLDKDAEIARADLRAREWREAHDTVSQTSTLLVRQNDELLDSARVNQQVIAAISPAARNPSRGGRIVNE